MTPPDDPVQPPPTDLDAIRAEIARRARLPVDPAEIARRHAAIERFRARMAEIPVLNNLTEDEILGDPADGSDRR